MLVFASWQIDPAASAYMRKKTGPAVGFLPSAARRSNNREQPKNEISKQKKIYNKKWLLFHLTRLQVSLVQLC